MKRILLVEDDKSIAKNLVLLLQSENFDVIHTASRKDALDALLKYKFDLALVDISLPDGNGFVLCTQLKEEQEVPVIFLTASGDETSVVTGLNMGGDDYITKPFRPRELIARIHASLRKYGSKSSAMKIKNLVIDMKNGTVKKNDKELYLSPLEYRLLLVFANNPNQIVTRTVLLDELWDVTGEFVNDNTLTVYIKRLREKIEDDPVHPEIILTVRGVGYRLGNGNVKE